MTKPEETKSWHIDKTIPLAIVGAIVAQTLVGTWWISSFVAQTANKIENIETKQKALDLLPERMAKQEAQLDAISTMLKDVKENVRDINKSVVKN